MPRFGYSAQHRISAQEQAAWVIEFICHVSMRRMWAPQSQVLLLVLLWGPRIPHTYMGPNKYLLVSLIIIPFGVFFFFFIFIETLPNAEIYISCRRLN